MDADGTVDNEYFIWRQHSNSSILGGAFILPDGTVNMDHLWTLPELFDVLAPGHFPKQSELQLYRDSLALMLPLTSLLEVKLAQAALLAPTARLAAGADIDLVAVLNGPSFVTPTETFQTEEGLTQQGIQVAEQTGWSLDAGTDLLRKVQGIMQSRRSERSDSLNFERLRQLVAARGKGA